MIPINIGITGHRDIQLSQIEQYKEKINVEKPVLVGHSLGGAICLNLAMKYPDKVKNLVLVNSAGVIMPFNIRLGSLPILKNFNMKTSHFMLKLFSRRSIYDKKLITKEWLTEAHKYANIDGSSRTMFAIIRENMNLFGLKKNIKKRFIDGFKNIKLPVLIICATNDKTIPNANSYHLHNQIPHSTLKVYDKCCHILHYECADKLAKDINRFLS